MTSWAQEGIGAPSPAPPAYSPLTEPAVEPPSRELSVNPNTTAAADTTTTTTTTTTNNNTASSNAIAHRDPSPVQLPPAVSTKPAVDNTDPMDIDDAPAFSSAPAAAMPDAFLPQSSALPTTLFAQDWDPSTPGTQVAGLPDEAGWQLGDQAAGIARLLERLRNGETVESMLSQAQAQTQALSSSYIQPAQISSGYGAGTGFGYDNGGYVDLYPAANNGLQDRSHASGNVGPGGQPSSYARLVFADSDFYLNSYTAIIGRDQRALKQARRDELVAQQYYLQCEYQREMGLPEPPPPTREKKYSKSYVSEEGGCLGPGLNGEDGGKASKRRRLEAGGSASGESQPQQGTTATNTGEGDTGALNVDREYVSNTPGAAPLNFHALRPDPHGPPQIIPIHSPGPNIAAKTKAISRRHMKIQYSPETNEWKAIPLHMNGFFWRDKHIQPGEDVVLSSGDLLQIKDVSFEFRINGVPDGETGAYEHPREENESAVSANEYSEGDKKMSFDFESNHDQEKPSTSDEEDAGEAQAVRADITMSDAVEPSEAEPSNEPPDAVHSIEDVGDSGVRDSIEKDDQQPSMKSEEERLQPLLALGEPPKRRGPGRPPKNGIMSKREEKLRKKQMAELEKANKPQPPPGEPPVKRKVGRPRKHPAPDDLIDPRPEKRKYKSRNKKNDEEGESDPERAVKEKRREKPKTPPLELRREDFTEEQLQKPNKNYSILIDEVLTAAAPDGLTLKQIYKRIQRTYPYYYFIVDTKGWESSVRHNLIGNSAFKKNDETHLWHRTDIDLDAGKKGRKASSPDHAAAMQNFGQPYQQPLPGHAGAFRNDHASTAPYHGGPGPQRPSYPTAHAAHGTIPHQSPQGLPPQTALPGQQLPRPTYQAAGQAAVPPQASGYQESYSGRPVQNTTPGPPFGAAYIPKPPTPAAQPGGTPQGMVQQPLQPLSGPSQVNGLPRTDRVSAQPPTQGVAGGPRPQPQASPAPITAPLKPAVPEDLLNFVLHFKKTVTANLADRCAAPEEVANSVANRGLGLTTKVLVSPGLESLEKIVFDVFQASLRTKGMALHPNLLKVLDEWKERMFAILMPPIQTRMEPEQAVLISERIVLSAMNRGLGFADKTAMKDTEYIKAEDVLIPIVRNIVLDHQRAVASAAEPPRNSTTPAPAPQTVPNTPLAPAASSPPVQVTGQSLPQQPQAMYRAQSSSTPGPVARATASVTPPVAASVTPPIAAPSGQTISAPVGPASMAPTAPAGTAPTAPIVMAAGVPTVTSPSAPTVAVPGGLAATAPGGTTASIAAALPAIAPPASTSSYPGQAPTPAAPTSTLITAPAITKTTVTETTAATSAVPIVAAPAGSAQTATSSASMAPGTSTTPQPAASPVPPTPPGPSLTPAPIQPTA